MKTLEFVRDKRGIATVRLDRPEKRNALSGEMISELDAVASRLSRDSAVRAVVISGGGSSFCAGADLDWMRRQFEASPEEKKREAMRLALMLKRWNELPKPVIARVHGSAFGGGLGLIAVSDISVAAKDAKFAFSEARLGLIPATISPYVAMRMGESNLRRVFLSARTFGAEEAAELKLVSRVVEMAEIDDAVEDEILPILACAPGAVARSKQLLRSLGSNIDEGVVEDTANRLAECWNSDEAIEGISAFFEKRRPSWTAARFDAIE